MKIEITELENILKNEYLKTKIEKIINDLQDSNINNNDKLYKSAQTLLEYINVKLLTQHLNINLPNYDIIKITEEYRKLDDNLFEEMVSVNGEYNIINPYEISDNDIIVLLFHLDAIYGYILEKYGNVI